MIKLAAWLFIIASCFCFMYSSNQILHNHDKCQTTSNINSAHEKVRTLIIPNTSFIHHIRQGTSDLTPLDLITIKSSSQRNHANVADHEEITQVKHIVFGIAASADLFPNRKEYLKTWWRKNESMRGVVWVDRKVNVKRDENLPQIRISGDTSHLRYTHPEGRRDALRLSRVVSETFRLGLKNVRWLVMGDDDTIFVAENVARVLSNYDHRHFYYIGAPSESHVQNIRYFSYAMAYGGGGFAISYPLAKELEKMQDRCMERYPGLYGSDDRMQACMAELGVPLTREIGFHQYDVFGNLLGLLAAHPVTPLVSLHHLDNVEPIFPNMNRQQGVRHLFKSVSLDTASVLQQSICYDKNRSWSISVSWGYVVQIIRGVMSPRELEMPSRTFLNWWKRVDYSGFSFNTRPATRHPCQVPFVYYMNKTWYDQRNKQIVGVYKLDKNNKHPFCRWRAAKPEDVDTIVMTKRPDTLRWQRSPRRDCCRVKPSRQRSVVYLDVGNCRPEEISEL